MSVGKFKKITVALIAGLLLSCLFALGASSCHAWTEDPHLHGSFCVAEQMQAPAPVSLDDTSSFVAVKNIFSGWHVATIFFVSLVLLIRFTDTPAKLFAKRMEQILTRHGPYQRIFLPYLMATHGM